jgi:acetyl esterase/lipase
MPVRGGGERRSRVRGRRRALGVAGVVALAAALVLGGCSDDEGDAEAGAPEEVVLPYGESSRQRVGLTRPEGVDEVPVVVLIHGGFWRSDVDRHAMDAIVESVVEEGWAAWNVEHRPTDDGGGWPETFEDVAAAVDEVAEVAEERHLDPARVVVLGHAGGGTLALWTGARAGLPDGTPGSDPVVRPVAVASLAGIPHLVAGSEEQLASGAVDELMGGPPGYEDDDPYLVASPAERLPLDVPQLLVAGDADPIVPSRQSSAYAARADEAGDRVTAIVRPGVDHNDVIDTRSEEWAEVLVWLHEQLDD